jgi:hydrogenase maturation protease
LVRCWVRLLESQYSFGDNVEVADIGTPALDLTHQIVGLHALILVDSVVGGDPPGTIVLYRKEDIVRAAPAQRLDPHSPALSECLMTAEMLGASPENVLLVGIVGECYEPGCPLTEAVTQSVGPAIDLCSASSNALGSTSRNACFPVNLAFGGALIRELSPFPPG